MIVIIQHGDNTWGPFDLEKIEPKDIELTQFTSEDEIKIIDPWETGTELIVTTND